MPDDFPRILAVITLATLALVTAIYFWRVARSTRYTLKQLPLYALNYLLTRILWRVHVRGRLELPPGQGAVIVCNHIGPIDPGIIALLAPRTVHWMVAREYVENRGIMGWGLRTLEVISTNRGGIDTTSTRAAIRLAKQGEWVGMFPEGRINTTDKLLLPGRLGAALVAIKSGVPIVPCYLVGAPNDGTPMGFFFIATKATLTVGPPIWPTQYPPGDDKESLACLTRRIMREIARLAGNPDWTPELAGRGWNLEDPAA